MSFHLSSKVLALAYTVGGQFLAYDLHHQSVAMNHFIGGKSGGSFGTTSVSAISRPSIDARLAELPCWLVLLVLMIC
ncbi:hypothetical protein [Escherichia coli]|uniref:hypothetical protein n=1 Tax=Escherichia coli TaxID=562 RepID=UPI0015932CA5|nr:hypothetical protein [Escherichia coli]QKY35697.1 hypothetical protein HR075_25375 [Escherichia coli]